MDGSRGAQALFEFIQDGDGEKPDWELLQSQIRNLKKEIVDKKMIGQLYKAEAEIAAKNGLAEYKFPTNQEMLTAIGLV